MMRLRTVGRPIGEEPPVAPPRIRGRTRALAWALCGLFVIATPTAADEQRRADDISGFTLADGFKIELFAADPAIAKPIQMNFDAAGRLWVVSSQSYPQLSPGAEPQDKVFILEDTDGDGKSDKSSVFAEGLMIPTGIELGKGGAYVGNGTELLHITDSDGDGKGDKREVVLSGFGTEDTHHLIHTFRWGPGGIMHFAQAVYIHSHVETPWGVRRLDGGGYWLYRPESSWLEVFVRGMTNTWGIAFDAYGQAFGVDNDNTSLNYFTPGASLIRTPNETRFLPSLVSNKPKYCGAEFVTGRHFPEDWQENIVTCDFRAHRVCRYRLTESGAGFAAEELPALVSSLDPEFRPIDLKMGPDGALYICDWFNPIINHGEVDFRDPRRDKTHGRIWRIVAKDRPRVDRPALVKAPVQALLEQQSSPEGWTRHFASRVLADRSRTEVIGELAVWSAAQTDELMLLRALWLYQTLDLPNSPLLLKVLAASDGRVRAGGARVLSYWLDRIADPQAILAKLIVDEHPRVRLEALRALAKLKTLPAAELALLALDKPIDPFLEYSLKLTIRESAELWLPSIGTATAGMDEPIKLHRWVYALLALDSPPAAKPLLELLQKGKISGSDYENVVAAIAKHGEPADIRVILDSLTSAGPAKKAVDQQVRLLDALAEAHRLRGVRPTGDLAGPLEKLLATDDEKLKVGALRLAAAWQVEALAPAITRYAESPKTPEAIRNGAFDALAKLGSSKPFFVRMAKESEDPAWRNKALAVLSALDISQAADLAVAILVEAKKPEDVTALFDAFVKLNNGGALLAQKLEGRTLPESIAAEGVRVVNANAQVASELTTALAKAGSLPEMKREYTPEQLAHLAAEALKLGDAARGEAVYRREKLNCVKCHAMRGTGGEVGPDLSGIGATAPVDYLVESLLEPNKKVKENYHSMIVATSDGEIITGIPVRKSDEEIVLRNAENKLVSIATRDVEESKTGGSIMPIGLADQLSSQDLLDLIRYLSELGKPGPYGPSREIIAKEWRLHGPLKPEEADKLEGGYIEAGAALGAKTTDWQKSLTANAGWVYLREFSLKPQLPIVFASCDLVTEQAGTIRFALEPGPAAKVWLDGKPLTAAQTVGKDSWYEVTLEPGRHALLLRIDVGSAPNFLKLRVYPVDETMDLKLLASGGE